VKCKRKRDVVWNVGLIALPLDDYVSDIATTCNERLIERRCLSDFPFEDDIACVYRKPYPR